MANLAWATRYALIAEVVRTSANVAKVSIYTQGGHGRINRSRVSLTGALSFFRSELESAG